MAAETSVSVHTSRAPGGFAAAHEVAFGKEVRVKDLDCHAVKALLTSRALLVKIKRDLENQCFDLNHNCPCSQCTVLGDAPWLAIDPSQSPKRRLLFLNLVKSYIYRDIMWLASYSPCGTVA